jgi:GTPase SAR1 family protein
MSNQTDGEAIVIWTEGKTDWMHLKTAMRKLGIKLPIQFHESDQPMGDDKLRKACEMYAERANPTPQVFIFDRDKENVVRAVTDRNNSYKSWNNNVFSFAIPEPVHRKGCTNISIEMYYKDEELKTADAHKRRLFLTSEFNERSGKHQTDKYISIGNKGVLTKATTPVAAKVVDSEVYDDNDRNIALSKAQFANYIADGKPPFDNFDFTAFRPIFDILTEIIRATRRGRSIFLPGFEYFFDSLAGEPPAYQLTAIMDGIKQLMSLTLQIFIVSTVRFYEDAIINEPIEYRKKVRPIKVLLREKFFSPSLASLHQTAEKCFYLVDATAPESLQAMKQCLEEVFTLDALGQILDDLEQIFPPKRGAVIQTNKALIRRPLLDYVIEEFAKYDNKFLAETERIADPLLYNDAINLESWREALRQLAQRLQPIMACPVELRSLRRVDARTGNYTVEICTYYGDEFSITEEQITSEEAEEYQTNFSRLLLNNNLAVHLYPMLLVKENTLYYYQRSRASGYEYYSFANDRIHIEPTKKKFNHALFTTGSTQEFFWTDVIPIVNPDNDIRANIPQEGLDGFIGRKRQKRIIWEEILEIPNQDGIVFGPGGIGKTALIQQVTQELYVDSSREEKLFDNIIWVSAKADYYDYIFGTTEPREQYSRSFDDILTAILQFYEFDNLDEYDFDDKKELVLEALSEYRTLLIVDNFETIPKNDAEKIVRFFRTEVKRRLRYQPDYFKVIITSRKQIPAGFHQIQLSGLDLSDSRALMRRLQEEYRAKHLLTEEQEREIHEATQGIPIVIKHCFGQLFEYNQPLQAILRDLTRYKSEIVQFSYKEILQQVESRDRSGIQIKILLLLELLSESLTIRQIAEIIGVDEVDVEGKLPLLKDFQCLQVVYPHGREKYRLNDEIRILTKSLAQQHRDLMNKLRTKVANSSIERGFDAALDELKIARIFENYVTEKKWLLAEDFITERLTERPGSALLHYQYAHYLAERKREYEEALNILEKIREASGNHPKVLRLLVTCYMKLDIPKYESAESYAAALEDGTKDDSELLLLLAEFYTDWSSQVKSQRELDPLDEMVRQQRYKQLAERALSLLDLVPGQARDDRYYHLCARCYFNKWNYGKALKMIERAMEVSDTPHVFDRFKGSIIATRDHYRYNRFGDVR